MPLNSSPQSKIDGIKNLHLSSTPDPSRHQWKLTIFTILIYVAAYYLLKQSFSLKEVIGDLVMMGMAGIFIVPIIYGVVEFTIGGLYVSRDKAKIYDSLKPRLDSLDRAFQDLEDKRVQLETEIEAERKEIQYQKGLFEKDIQQQTEAVQLLATQKAKGFPWLAGAYADYFHLIDLKTARTLEKKKRPAIKAAEEVKKISRLRRESEKKARILDYQVKYYESLFPWLVEFKDETIDDVLIEVSDNQIEKNEDPASRWLSQSEYRNLSTSEKYQLALERYFRNRKSKWQIGRDYERYIGYLYETSGFKVYYQGAIEGFNDLGRDIIAYKGNLIKIVQCKNWSKEKTIHEKHIFQLYGTVIAYEMDNPDKVVQGVFVTTTNLSERAKQFADKLGIEIKDEFPFKVYPCIKCNISRKDGTKIYHLPFDQQYDKVSVELDRNECYVGKISEAEELGFRRAFRWHPE